MAPQVREVLVIDEALGHPEPQIGQPHRTRLVQVVVLSALDLEAMHGDIEATATVLSYVTAWAALSEKHDVPSTAAFADYWRRDIALVRADEALFVRAFPGEASPEPLI